MTLSFHFNRRFQGSRAQSLGKVQMSEHFLNLFHHVARQWWNRNMSCLSSYACCVYINSDIGLERFFLRMWLYSDREHIRWTLYNNIILIINGQKKPPTKNMCNLWSSEAFCKKFILRVESLQDGGFSDFLVTWNAEF